MLGSVAQVTVGSEGPDPACAATLLLNPRPAMALSIPAEMAILVPRRPLLCPVIDRAPWETIGSEHSNP
jgi:hypothetical protein